MQTRWAAEGSPQPAPIAPNPPLPSIAKQLWVAIGSYYVAQLNAYAATTMYEQLSRLSDAELTRRGMSRNDLHRHVFERMTTRL